MRARHAGHAARCGQNALGAGIVCAAFAAPLSFAQTALRLPQGPQILSRQLTRSLSNGNQIKVTRSWQVQFARANQNVPGQIAITGVQISSEVEAPPSLNQLAAIERQRPTDGMWPIMLTPSGLILAAGRPMRQQDIEDALDTGQRMMAARMGQQNAANMVGTFCWPNCSAPARRCLTACLTICSFPPLGRSARRAKSTCRAVRQASLKWPMKRWRSQAKAGSTGPSAGSQPVSPTPSNARKSIGRCAHCNGIETPKG